MPSGAQSCNCDIVWVSSKGFDVLLDPFEKQLLILESKVQQSLFGRELAVQESQCPNSVIERKCDERLLGPCEHGSGVMHRCKPAIESAAMDINKDRQLLLMRESIPPSEYVQSETIFACLEPRSSWDSKELLARASCFEISNYFATFEERQYSPH